MNMEEYKEKEDEEGVRKEKHVDKSSESIVTRSCVGRVKKTDWIIIGMLRENT